MSGKFNGVAVLIKKEYLSVSYVHCNAHNLNLSVSKACNTQEIKNITGYIEAYYNFSNAQRFF